MHFEIPLSTDPRFVGLIPAPDPILPPDDPIASILKALGAKLEELGCPACCSGEDLTFIKESADLGGGGTIIGNGFKLERVTRLNDNLALLEGVNGSGINIGKLKPGETIDAEELAPEEAHIALLVGKKEVMYKFEALESMLKRPAPDVPELNEQLSSLLREKLGSFDAIGFTEFPLVLRTNDPLIT